MALPPSKISAVLVARGSFQFSHLVCSCYGSMALVRQPNRSCSDSPSSACRGGKVREKQIEIYTLRVVSLLDVQVFAAQPLEKVLTNHTAPVFSAV